MLASLVYQLYKMWNSVVNLTAIPYNTSKEKSKKFIQLTSSNEVSIYMYVILLQRNFFLWQFMFSLLDTYLYMIFVF
jgi:hypothetical protein